VYNVIIPNVGNKKAPNTRSVYLGCLHSRRKHLPKGVGIMNPFQLFLLNVSSAVVAGIILHLITKEL